MDLGEHLRRQRDKEKRKIPFERSLFARVSGLVRRYGLQEGFLGRLQADRGFRIEGEPAQLQAKKEVELPLFSLATAEEYRLAMAIIARVDNPYLNFARCPEEILLCAPLFRLNPGLDTATLSRHHFGALLLADLDRKEASEEV